MFIICKKNFVTKKFFFQKWMKTENYELTLANQTTASNRKQTNYVFFLR